MQDEPHAPDERHFTDRFGFLRPNWQTIATELGDGASLTDAMAVHWLEHLVAHRGAGARLRRGEQFHLVELPAGPDNEHVLRWAEQHRAEILRHLPGIAEPMPLPLPLLLFAEVDDFVSYYADFTPDNSPDEIAGAGGMFINVGMPHIAAPVNFDAEAMLAHELTHACLSHLPLPLWLNEGFAVAMEQLLMRRPQQPTTEDLAEHRRTWDAETIQWFWSGRAFRAIDTQRLAYQLAPLIARGLSRNYAKLQRFANAAHANDAGEAGSRAVYGRGIAELVVPVLGPGPWAPAPDRWYE